MCTCLYSSITLGSTTITVWDLEPELCDWSRTWDINSFSRPCSAAHKINALTGKTFADTLIFRGSMMNEYCHRVSVEEVTRYPSQARGHKVINLCRQFVGQVSHWRRTVVPGTGTVAFMFPFQSFKIWVYLRCSTWMSTMLTLYWAGFFNSLCIPSSRTLGMWWEGPYHNVSFIKHEHLAEHRGTGPQPCTNGMHDFHLPTVPQLCNWGSLQAVMHMLHNRGGGGCGGVVGTLAYHDIMFPFLFTESHAQDKPWEMAYTSIVPW